MVSSVREVLPGRTYFIPNTGDKEDPFTVERDIFVERVMAKPMAAAKALYLLAVILIVNISDLLKMKYLKLWTNSDIRIKMK